MYWSIIGTFITVFVGTLISFLTPSKDDTYEAKLLHPLIVKCLSYIPGQPREFKQAPVSRDSISTQNTDTVTVEVQDKVGNGQDNFAYETEDAKVSQQRITNMTINDRGAEHLEMTENKDKEGVARIQDKFYSPETTGVYKRYEAEC